MPELGALGTQESLGGKNGIKKNKNKKNNDSFDSAILSLCTVSDWMLW